MRDIPLLRVPYQDWYCPNCNASERVPSLPPGSSRFHTCPGLHGLTAPLVIVGADCDVRAIEREDYTRGEIQATGDNGRVYMAISTVYADGHNDLAVQAPVATVRADDLRG